MKAEENVIDRIEKRKLKWFGHLNANAATTMA